MPSTASVLFDMFKRNYGEGSDVLRQQQNLSAPFFETLPTSSLKPSIQGAWNVVSMRGNEDGGAINELEGFQEPGSLKPVQPVIYSKLVVWPFKVSGKVIRESQGDKIAFAQSLNAQQKDNLSRLYSDLDRQALGTGTGQITLANGAGVASTSLVVDDVFSFRRGMKIDAYATLGGAKQIDGIEITDINYTTSTLTLASAQTWSDNAIIGKKNVLAGVTSSSDAKEIMGWRGICDTTTYSSVFEGVTVATYPEWQGNVVDAAVAPISQDLLQRAYNQQAVIGGEKADTLLSNYGQERVFLNTELQKTRYDPTSVKAGNKILSWGNLEWMVMHNYPIGEVGMMVKKDIQKFMTKDVHLADLSGNTLYQYVGTDVVGGYYAFQGNVGTWKRNNQARIINLTEPTF